MADVRSLRTNRAIASHVRFASYNPCANFNSIAAKKRRFTRLKKHVYYLRTQKTTRMKTTSETHWRKPKVDKLADLIHVELSMVSHAKKCSVLVNSNVQQLTKK